MFNIEYQKKYFKYKTKYLKLIGGTIDNEIKTFIEFVSKVANIDTHSISIGIENDTDIYLVWYIETEKTLYIHSVYNTKFDTLKIIYNNNTNNISYNVDNTNIETLEKDHISLLNNIIEKVKLTFLIKRKFNRKKVFNINVISLFMVFLKNMSYTSSNESYTSVCFTIWSEKNKYYEYYESWVDKKSENVHSILNIQDKNKKESKIGIRLDNDKTYIYQLYIDDKIKTDIYINDIFLDIKNELYIVVSEILEFFLLNECIYHLSHGKKINLYYHTLVLEVIPELVLNRIYTLSRYDLDNISDIYTITYENNYESQNITEVQVQLKDFISELIHKLFDGSAQRCMIIKLGNPLYIPSEKWNRLIMIILNNIGRLINYIYYKVDLHGIGILFSDNYIQILYHASLSHSSYSMMNSLTILCNKSLKESMELFNLKLDIPDLINVLTTIDYEKSINIQYYKLALEKHMLLLNDVSISYQNIFKSAILIAEYISLEVLQNDDAIRMIQGESLSIDNFKLNKYQQIIGGAYIMEEYKKFENKIKLFITIVSEFTSIDNKLSICIDDIYIYIVWYNHDEHKLYIQSNYINQSQINNFEIDYITKESITEESVIRFSVNSNIICSNILEENKQLFLKKIIDEVQKTIKIYGKKVFNIDVLLLLIEYINSGHNIRYDEYTVRINKLLDSNNTLIEIVSLATGYTSIAIRLNYNNTKIYQLYIDNKLQTDFYINKLFCNITNKSYRLVSNILIYFLLKYCLIISNNGVLQYHPIILEEIPELCLNQTYKLLNYNFSNIDKVKQITDNYKLSAGIDAGGLRKQFFCDLMYNLFDGDRKRILNMKSGYPSCNSSLNYVRENYYPSISSEYNIQLNEIDKESLHNIGKLLSYIYGNELLQGIGQLFPYNYFDVLRYAKIEPESIKYVSIVCDPKLKESMKLVAFNVTNLTNALEYIDVNKSINISTYTKALERHMTLLKEVSESYSEIFACAKHIVTYMENSILYDLRAGYTILGEHLNANDIINRMNIIGNNPIFLEKINFLKQRIEEYLIINECKEKTEQEKKIEEEHQKWIINLLFCMTGKRGISTSTRLYFKGTNTLLCYAHTCFSSMDIPITHVGIGETNKDKFFQNLQILLDQTLISME